MKKLVGSAKPGCRMVRVSSRRVIIYWSTILVRRVKQYDIMRSLVRKHYRRALSYNKRRINKVFTHAGLPVPAYKDCQVTDIVLFIKEASDKTTNEIAQAIIEKFDLCTKQEIG